MIKRDSTETIPFMIIEKILNIRENKPIFSFLILCYDMAEEVKNTLSTLTPKYQNEEKQNYEILITENPSHNNINTQILSIYNAHIRYYPNKQNIPLTKAINDLAQYAKGDYLIVIPDGARLLSSGIIKYCKQAIKIEKKSIVAFHGFHLGLFPQQISLKENLYSKEQELSFLQDIKFPQNPHALFFNACWAGSSKSGSFFQMAESNCLMLPKKLWNKVGGYDERLDSPSGGLANLDLYSRVISEEDHKLFFVLGEGSFHQLHDGDTTNNDTNKFSLYKEEYLKKTGKVWKFPTRDNFDYLGHISSPYLRLLKESVISTIALHQRKRPIRIQNNIKHALAHSFDLPDNISFTFIMSMHRSKSSYLTGKIAETINAFIPGTILGGTSRSNAKGHFEPWEIVVYHNNILNELGYSWRSISEIDFHDEQFIELKAEQIGKLLNWGIDISNTKLSKNQSIIIKDPRLARVWPIWARFLTKAGFPHKKIVLIDHPDKIANSLFKRDKLNKEWSKLLWARYTLDSIKSMNPEDIIIDVYKNKTKEIEKQLNAYFGSNIDLSDYIESGEISGEGDISEAYRKYVLNNDLNKLACNLESTLEFVSKYKSIFKDIDGYVNQIS